MAASASTTSATLLRLRVFALERVGLDENHVGVGFGIGILSGGIDADQVAGNELEFLKRKGRGSIGLPGVFLREEVGYLLGAAVDGVMQREAFERVFVGCFDCDGYLFDGAGVIIAVAGPHQRDLGRVGFAGFNEEILADANGLARFKAGDVINAVLIHLYGAAVDVVCAACERDLLSVIELEFSAGQGAVG